MHNFDYYKNKIVSGYSELEVIKEARNDFNLNPDYSFKIPPFNGTDIPFNIEREYLIKLIDNKKYQEAKNLIEEMKLTYKTVANWNFIEIFEYHLRAAIHADKNIELAIVKAKKEFNQHTINIVSVVVGVITLLGTANQVFVTKNFGQALGTFITIVLSTIAIIIVVFSMNRTKNL